MERQYGGQSLAYMRVIARGQYPRAASCKALFNELKKVGKIGPANRQPTTGDLLLFPNVSPYGDIGLYLGNGLMLLMQSNSRPVIVRLDYYAKASFYILERSPYVSHAVSPDQA